MVGKGGGGGIRLILGEGSGWKGRRIVIGGK